MNVSIIIPTFNGRHKLQYLSDALLKQTYLDFKLIVVVDGSTDGTVEWLKGQDYSSLKEFELIEQKNGGRANARNKGVEAVEEGLMIFLDDDIIPSNNLVQKHVEHHQNYADTWLTAGSWLEDKPYQTHFERYRLEVEDGWRQNQTHSGKSKISLDNLSVSGSNVSMTKALFVRLGGFDKQLTDNEDLDLCIRALNQGIEIYNDPYIEAIHNDQVNFNEYAKRIREYQISLKRLIEKKPSYSNYISLYNPSFIKRMLVFVFQKLGLDKWNNRDIMEKLPYGLRKKMFDMVIGIELDKTYS